MLKKILFSWQAALFLASFCTVSYFQSGDEYWMTWAVLSWLLLGLTIVSEHMKKNIEKDNDEIQ